VDIFSIFNSHLLKTESHAKQAHKSWKPRS